MALYLDPLLPVYRSQILVQFPFSHDERGPFTYTPKLIPTQIPNCFFKNIEWLKFRIPVWTPLFDPWVCSPQILTEFLVEPPPKSGVTYLLSMVSVGLFVCMYVCMYVDSYNLISTIYTRWLRVLITSFDTRWHARF